MPVVPGPTLELRACDEAGAVDLAELRGGTIRVGAFGSFSAEYLARGAHYREF